MPTAQIEKNGTYTGRARKPGLDESKGGFKTKRQAQAWARQREEQFAKARGERGLGPHRTVVADALVQNALETLPFKKGAVQEANRLNVVLRLAGRPIIVVTKCPTPVGANEAETFERRKAQIQHFEVQAQRNGTQERTVVPSLAAHRASQEETSEESRKVLRRLALMKVSELTCADLDDLVRARALEGRGASTLRHDVHIFRSMINRVRKAWNWLSIDRIQDGDVQLPELPEGRKVVCRPEQEKALAAAMATSYQPKALSATAMLIETAMRFTECMDTARWCDIDWQARVIRLSQAKAGARDVPLNENAMQVLRAMTPGEPHEPIFGFSYEAYKKIFERACQRAGIEGLQVHDLRHTAATRAAKRFNGNTFLLQALTGHRTLSQLQRYVHVDASDVVEAFDQTAPNASAPAMAAAATRGAAQEAKELRASAQHRAAEVRAAGGGRRWPERKDSCTARPVAVGAAADAPGACSPVAVDSTENAVQDSALARHRCSGVVISLAERRRHRMATPVEQPDAD